MEIATEKPYKIYADVLEQGALDQFESAMQQPFAVRGALMPDSHQGYTLPIGAVVATDSVVVPSWVGYDIGCGMCAVPTSFSVEDVRTNAQAIFNAIYATIPVGYNHNQNPTPWKLANDLPKSDKMAEIFARDGLLQLGSLGSGNHFIEIGESSGTIWVVVHSGSRGIGHATASHYMRLAANSDKPVEGHFGLAATSSTGKDYIQDLNFCLEFALANRREIITRACRAIETVASGAANFNELINRNHNHAEDRNGLWIHRKGATHAENGMMGVIPGNMRDGSFIVRGKGNPDSLYSSSHGAGRVLGRKAAQRTLKLEDFTATMSHVVARVTTDTLDESPFAYKDIFDVMRLQSDLVEIVAHVAPIINIKG